MRLADQSHLFIVMTIKNLWESVKKVGFMPALSSSKQNYDRIIWIFFA